MGTGWMSPKRKMDRDVEKILRRLLTFAQTESKVSAMSGKKRTKMGRPPKLPEEKMSHRVCVRLTPEQFQRLVSRAKQARLSLSAFIQSRLED